ncbi:MAG: hypothetical protein V3V16_00990 [Melioribacteraceae bacterium]
MKGTIKIVLAVLFLLMIGCNDSNNNSSNPLGLEPLGGEVSFEISLLQNQQGKNVVFFKPSVDVKIVKIVATLNTQQAEEITGDGTTVFKASDGFSIEPANIKTGDVYKFVITGKIAKDSKDFTTTVNFTVPQVTGGGTGNVTFVVSVHQQQGQSGFLFKPSVDFKLTKFEATLNGNPAGEITGDGTSIYTVAGGLFISLNTPPASNEKWDFVITGTIDNDGKGFTSNINYTVP